MEGREPLVIVGGGLAGALAALALVETRPQLPVLLIESGELFGGNHVWSYFDGDVDAKGLALIEPLQPHRWPSHRIRFPKRERTLGFGYNSIHSGQLDRLVRERLQPGQFRTRSAVTALDVDGITLASGEKIAALGVIDARGPRGAMPGLDLGWQKFVGVELDAPGHSLSTPMIMDATVEQIGGYRFIYSLPFSADRILVEDTYYSDTPNLDVPAVRARVLDYASARGWRGDSIREETGVLPILLGGDPGEFWPAGDPVARLGVAGGFFQATTGYSLPLAVGNALALAQRKDFTGAALANWSRALFLEHWRKGRFYRALNRMLFGAPETSKRVRVFEHFYRLPEEIIARFYAGTLSLADKARIVAGRPPVPVGPALRALVG